MQITGKLGNFRQVPFYLGHVAGDAYHINVLCDETGKIYDRARLDEAGIDPVELTEFVAEHLEDAAQLLRKPIERIGLRATPGQPPAIIEFA